MDIPGKGMTNFLALRTKISNKKQKAGFDITDISNQDFRKFLKRFNNSPYICYKSKQVHNEPIKSYLFLIKKITKLMKSLTLFNKFGIYLNVPLTVN